MKFTIEQLNEKSKHRPNGYFNDVMSKSIKIEDDLYELDDASFKELSEKWRLPSIFEMIKNLSEAAHQACSNGFDVRNGEETKRVLEICASCPYLIESDLRCGSCGCMLEYKTKIKSWHCPQEKW